ncbi:MAG: S49 family peptidase [Caulobacteraceae bacterium]|nr:S49 family peptidase [Caulobacteraceae bacterium]
MQRFGHLAQRLLNAPLAIHPRKAEVIVAALADRLNIAVVHMADPAEEDYDFTSPRRGRPADRNADPGYDVLGGVALIPVAGTLVQKTGAVRPWSGMTGYDGLRQAFLTAVVDPAAKAIVFDVDSPGGEVAGCFDLVDAIHQARGEKPIAAVLNEVAFSAAYALVSAVDPGRIYVPRTGGVGSIGVIAMHVDWSEAIAQAGIKPTLITFGEKKADGRPEIPLSAGALKDLQVDIDALGELFVETVARNRDLSVKAVRDMQAATYLGAAGVRAGLADAVMAPSDAFRALLAELG